ncbi:hypothetical protein [Domibacillus epiphyticus]|uniref:Uncharacterized protein n=1 Tax=Domibacillus epiphyticus TaxID=1714355 RepID=A0A1V2ACK0_9BACI|nr:hypothetical protein [Domibacillus epiphyticus]OMP68709.1 hypothetical protein BTO28_01280 [Domibacillus epiphyticus]
MLNWEGNLETIEHVHEWLNLCSHVYYGSDSDQTIRVDLSDLGKLSPAGCTVLSSTLDYLNLFFYLDITIPKNRKIISYMERMNFFRVCSPEIKNKFERQTNMDLFYNRHRNNKENKLFEITKCENPDDVGTLHNSITKILKKTSKLPKDRIADIANIVSELGNNALEHAECPPFSCIQYYDYNNVVKIAICDTGKGIYNSLKKAVNSNKPDHVIREAILTTASRHVNDNRGKGLVDVKSRAYNFSNVNFYLRSHNCAYTIEEDDLVVLAKGDYFFGTYFYLTIEV